jgi:uncharacterized protein (TIGR02118 family)
MFRISITYRNKPGENFNWDYYMNNHLPLAVGTSRRHSELNFSDADKPLGQEPPYACVCMVHFDNEETMNDFCNFFVNEHPESDRINNDEINYTTIPPNMVAAESDQITFIESQGKKDYRCKLFFPFVENIDFSRSDVKTKLLETLNDEKARDSRVLSTELDFCTSGIVPGSEPDYSLIWAVCFDSLNDMQNFTLSLGDNESFQLLKSILQTEPEIMSSEVMAFDMALTEPYRVLS